MLLCQIQINIGYVGLEFIEYEFYPKVIDIEKDLQIKSRTQLVVTD